MAKKDLARATLEAGNTGAYQDARRWDVREHRREAKAYCRRARRDPEWCDGASEPAAPERRDRNGLCRYELHGDRVGGLNRWLATTVGRHWDDVYAEVRRRFDVRTLAGWHVVTQHIVWAFAREGTHRAAYAPYTIGANGIIRSAPSLAWRHRERAQRPRATVSDAELAAWLRGWRVARRGAALFWLEPTPASHWNTVQVPGNYDWRTGTRAVVRAPQWMGYYRQAQRLSRAETAFFDRLSAAQRHCATTTTHEPDPRPNESIGIVSFGFGA